jgi:WD40 repeat protein
VVSSSGDGIHTLRILSFADRELVRELKGHTGALGCVAVTPDGHPV